MQPFKHISPNKRRLTFVLVLMSSAALLGCDYLGIEPASKANEIQVAEGKAIGGGCRHANRALEDCYRYNPKAVKAAVFEGWRDMDLYMREFKLETIAPVTPPEPAKKPAPKPVDKAADGEEIMTEKADDPPEKTSGKKASVDKN